MHLRKLRLQAVRWTCLSVEVKRAGLPDTASATLSSVRQVSPFQ